MPDNTTDTALVHVIPGRPTVIEHEGCKVYITVHDQYYLSMLREWKGKLRLSHPDLNRGTKQVIVPAQVRSGGLRGGRNGYSPSGVKLPRPYLIGDQHVSQHIRVIKIDTSGEFRRLMREFERWKKREEMWYAQWGLTPPSWGD